jgi:hypothetical protein
MRAGPEKTASSEGGCAAWSQKASFCEEDLPGLGSALGFRRLARYGGFTINGDICWKKWGRAMTKREAGFLLIGLDFGLMLALAVILEVLLSLYNYNSALITA